MRKDLETVWQLWQSELFENQFELEKEASKLYEQSPGKTRSFLTEYSLKWAEKIVKRGWSLGDELWTKYDEKF